MPNENTVSFKVYILDENESVEVRRFEVDQGAVTNYDYIRERLQVVFPKLRGKAFRILWKDAEEDEVTISSDEEMMIALAETKSDLFKLIVRLSDSSNSSQEKPFSVSFQVGCPALGEDTSVCNSCEKPIQGYRYKCLECLHFNQCSVCEYKGAHPDHVMIRLTQNYPTLISLIPKGLDVLRQHLGSCLYRPMRGKCFAKSFFREHSRREEKEKHKEHHHRRKARKHSHSEKPTAASSSQECPVAPYMFGDIEGLISSFLNMFPKAPVVVNQQPMETDDSSSQEDNAAGTSAPDGPPQPSKVSKIADDEFVDLSQPEPETSSKPQNPKILEAVRVLTEMGFKDEGKWLSTILEQFDGDITKALDFLTQRPK